MAQLKDTLVCYMDLVLKMDNELVKVQLIVECMFLVMMNL